MIDRDLKFIQVLKQHPIGELSWFFRRSLQENGINSGIIDRLMVCKQKYDFLYELYKILDEATNGCNKNNRQKIIKEFGNYINFEFNFTDDSKMIHNIFLNFKDYNKVCNIDD
ncbi:hypothetical protein [Sulfurospirillum cavolei]|uniref:hypothetical protein n=1 Tax=Sulfurospirillum cavolei TaxID=366522 RepID=UPI000764BA10|nr:hypothetical protein [Sulfurospirillum cavolei]